MSFFNEVAGRHPNAISFAAGAPDPEWMLSVASADDGERYMAAVTRGAAPGQRRQRSEFLTYGPSKGILVEFLAEELSLWLGVHVTPKSLTTTSGAQEAYVIALSAIVRGGSEVLFVPDPCYPGILGAAQVLRIPTRRVAEGHVGMEAASIESAIESAVREGLIPRAIYVAPDYSNPSGAMYSEENRKGVVEAATRWDLAVIEDSTYGFMRPDRTPSSGLISSSDRIFHVGTFSKLLYPSARMGYVVRSADLHGSSKFEIGRDLADIKAQITVNTSGLSQVAVAGHISRVGGLRKLAALAGSHYSRKIVQLEHELAEVGLSRPNSMEPGGFFRVLEVGVAATPSSLEDCAGRFGVLWSPMQMFYGGAEEQGKSAIRLSPMSLQPARITEGVRRLERFVSDRLRESHLRGSTGG